MKSFFKGYLVCLHLAILLLMWAQFGPESKGTSPPPSAGLPAPQEAPAAELTEHYHRMVKYHRLMDDNVAAGSAIFVGDSMVQGLWVAGVSPSAVNYGIGGDTTFGVLNRIPHYKSLQRARVAVIAVGLNDLGIRGIDRTIENIVAIASSIPREVPIVFSAVLPINEQLRREMQGRNAQIKALNAKIREFCCSSDRLAFVDIGPQVSSPDGNLASAYSDSGGVHLNARGNDVWIAELKRVTAAVARTEQR